MLWLRAEASLSRLSQQNSEYKSMRQGSSLISASFEQNEQNKLCRVNDGFVAYIFPSNYLESNECTQNRKQYKRGLSFNVHSCLSLHSWKH